MSPCNIDILVRRPGLFACPAPVAPPIVPSVSGPGTANPTDRQTRVELVPDDTTRAESKRHWRFAVIMPLLAKRRRKKLPGLPPPVRPTQSVEPRLNAPGVQSLTILFLFQDHANVRTNERRGEKRPTVGDTGHGRSFLPDGHRRAGHRSRGQPQIGRRQKK